MSAQDLESHDGAGAAAERTAIIDIDGTDLAELKANGYSLCFARRLGGGYSVVWRALDDYLHRTMLSWTQQYILFGTSFVQAGSTVFPETNLQPISLGQQSVLDANGNLLPPEPGRDMRSIIMINQFGPIHTGLSAVSTLNGESAAKPFFVTQDPTDRGYVISLIPTDGLLVWFAQGARTSEAFTNAPQNSAELDFAESLTVNRRYTGGKWVSP
jgi:hypothetical protein